MKKPARLLLSLALGLSIAQGACDSGSAPRSEAPRTASTPATTTSPRPAETPTRRIEVRVDAQGYHPSSIEVNADESVVLVVTRTSDEGCGQQIAIPDLDIRRDLPLDTPVEIMIRPTHGPLRFTCGMDMLEGTIVVK